MKAFIGKVFNKKSLILFIAIFLVISSAIYIAPYFYDWDGKREGIIEYVETGIGRKVEVVSIDYQPFPFPHLEINEVKIRNKEGGVAEYLFHSDKVSVFPSIFYLFIGKLELSRAVFDNPVVELENFIGEDSNWNDFFGFSGSFSISGTSINNGRINYSSGKKENPSKRSLVSNESHIRLGSIFSELSIYGDASLVVADNKTPSIGYELDVGGIGGDSHSTKLFIYSDESNLTARGTLKGWGDDFSFLGNMSSSVVGIKTSFDGDFSASNEEIDFANINIKFFDSVGKGGGSIVFGDVIKISESFNFDHLDAANALFLSPLDKYIVSDDINYNLNLTSDKVTINNKTVESANISIESKGGKILLHSLSAENLPGESSISASGDISRENEGLKFSGKIISSGKAAYPLLEWIGVTLPEINKDMAKDFSFHGKVVASSEDINIEKAKIKFDDTNLVGKAKIIYGDTVSISSAFKADKINLDKYMVEHEEGNASDGLTSRFDAIRNLGFLLEKLAVSMSVKNIVYNEEEIKDLSALVQLSKGVLNFRRISFDSKIGKAEGSATIDSRKLSPVIDADIRFNRLDVGFLPDFIGYGSGNDEGLWPQKELNFGAFNIFSGKIKLFAKELVHGDFQMQDLKTEFNINTGDIEFSSFTTKVFDGNADIKGRVNTNYPSINITYSINNGELSSFFGSLFGIDKVSGRFSISGSLSMSGGNMNSLISSAQGVGNIAARGIYVNGVDMLLLSRKIPAMNSAKEVRYWIDTATSSGRSELNYSAGRFTIVAGNISANDIILDSAILDKSTLDAEINLPDRKMNLNSDLRIKTRLGDIPTSFSAIGDISNPEKSWDKKSMEKFWEVNFFRNGG